jgi:hypothetical protein
MLSRIILQEMGETKENSFQPVGVHTVHLWMAICAIRVCRI